MEDSPTPLIVIDSANVVGSRPDGWWRDRRGATMRLRDRLADLADTGLPHGGPAWSTTPPVEVVLITEGQAKGVASIDTVTVVDAPGAGDDTIVATVEAVAGRHCLVVTSDRLLRQRVKHAGGAVIGAGVLRLSSAPTRSRAVDATDVPPCSRFNSSHRVNTATCIDLLRRFG